MDLKSSTVSRRRRGRNGVRRSDPDVRIGCSGWQYKHWRGVFYPAELPSSRWFAHYALQFDTVEINNSFYRLPAADTFERWRAQAPARFCYAVKASRFLTHMKKLKDPDDPLFRFFDSVKHLGPTLGPILYQLPPRWPMNLERLGTFLRALAPTWKRASGTREGARHAVEFRDPSWYDDRVFTLLERYGVALCLHDMQGSASGRLLVGPFVYVRFHFGESTYGGAYDDARLDDWGRWLADQIDAGRDVFAYFNNDAEGHAPRDAVRLRNRLRRRRAASLQNCKWKMREAVETALVRCFRWQSPARPASHPRSRPSASSSSRSRPKPIRSRHR